MDSDSDHSHAQASPFSSCSSSDVTASYITTESTSPQLQRQLSSLDLLTQKDLTIMADAIRQRKKMKRDKKKGDGQADDYEDDREGEGEAEEEGIKKLMDAPLPVSASSLTVGAPPEFRVRVLFGLIPKWIYIVGLLFFTMSLEDFADNLADNAERLQEMEFFSGMDCDGINPIPDQCIRGNTQQQTVENLSKGAKVVLMFLVSPFLGSLVDIYGRRPLFIFMMFLHAVHHLFTVLRWLIPSVFTYYYITIWQTIAGGIVFGVTETIVTDVVPPQHRSIFIGASLAVFQISDLFLPQISIHIEPKVAFPAVAALGTASLFFACLMPETLLEKYHTVKKFSWSAASPVKAFSILLRYRILTLFALIMFILGFCISASETLLDSAVGYRFPTSPTFNANQESIVSGFEMLNVTVVQYFLLRYFSQRQVLIGSTVCLFISIIGSATLTAAWQIYLWIIPLTAVGIIAPVITQIISQYVEHEEFGSALTVVITLEAFGEGIGAQLVLPLYLFWSPPPHTHGPSAGGSMTYFPQILFGMICFILCVMVWQLEPPSEGEKIDYRRTKRKLEREASDEAAAAPLQANEHLLGSSSVSINGGDDPNAAVLVNMSAMSSMGESLLDLTEQDQL